MHFLFVTTVAVIFCGVEICRSSEQVGQNKTEVKAQEKKSKERVGTIKDSNDEGFQNHQIDTKSVTTFGYKVRCLLIPSKLKTNSYQYSLVRKIRLIFHHF